MILQMEAATPEKDRLAAQRLMDQYRRDLESLSHDMDSENNRQLADLQVLITSWHLLVVCSSKWCIEVWMMPVLVSSMWLLKSD